MKILIPYRSQLLITLMLLFWNTAFPQYTASGIVRDNEGNLMPGVTVSVNQSETATVTDVNGAFILTCSKQNQLIQFSFVGFLQQQLPANSSMEVILQPDQVPLTTDASLICYFYDRNTKIGPSSGAFYTPIGIRIENFTPSVFSVSPMLTTIFEWRTNNASNHYLNVSARKHNLFYLRRHLVGVIAEYKHLRTQSISVNEYNLASDLSIHECRFSAGYTYQKNTQSDLLIQGHGVYAAVHSYLFHHLGMDLKTKYVLNRFQHDIKFYWDFNQPKITVGLGYEKINHLNEMTGSIQYRFSY